MPGYESTVPASPAPEYPYTKIYCAGRPCISAPAPHHQAGDPAQPAKQKLPNRPNLSGPILNQQLAGPGSPKTRSANLGFEIRGFSHPCRRLSPKRPHAAKFAKPVYQTNPIPTADDNAIGRASGCHRPACRPAPKRQNRTTKQTQSRRTHPTQRLSRRPPLTCRTPVACRVAIPGDRSYPHNRTISRPHIRRQSPNRLPKPAPSRPSPTAESQQSTLTKSTTYPKNTAKHLTPRASLYS